MQEKGSAETHAQYCRKQDDRNSCSHKASIIGSIVAIEASFHSKKSPISSGHSHQGGICCSSNAEDFEEVAQVSQTNSGNANTIKVSFICMSKNTNSDTWE
mmetsp:Transcript_9056/g.15746  ORF Transcript_9056/g.15746 Transcript_9056/m.15746 type:complete len:101 (+) Transcript_9056:1352-1654(+)